jgi:glutamine synthetase
VYVGWAQTNRSALIRIPRYTKGQDKAIRAELRCPDPSCNPYLAFSAMLAAALDGIDRGVEPPAPLNNVNVYHLTEAERQERGVRQLPGSLQEALQELDENELLKSVLGSTIYEAFRRAKLEEWETYRINVTDWELSRYLEIA